MSSHHWHWIPIGLVAAAVAAVASATGANAGSLGWWQMPIWMGCVLAVVAAVWFRRKLSVTEIELDALRQRLAGEEMRLASDRSQFEELRLAMQEELKQEAIRLGKREQSLADRLVTYHEWMEFPQPLELGTNPVDDPRLMELAKKDREMLELLKAETKLLYDRILQNKYAPEGQVSLPAIRDDVVSLVNRVARIYQPLVEQPLLEASLTRVFRAISRASLQMLVVLDELPVDVKHASLNQLYGYVRSAVSTWRMYKSTEPYWPYVNTAWYAGRMALGANPLALGAWWFVGNLSSRGAKAVAQHLVNRQALAMLSELVRVIGYEVASIYGGDFRHRDANWIYAAELTELISEFPLSRDSLSHALREIGVLDLRSEYDRIFLYRCLADGKSAKPARYAATTALTINERRAIATRLERFLETFVHGKSADRVSRWKAAAEERLGVKLSVALKSTAVSVREQLVDAASSLASFLVAVKQLEPPEASLLLEKTRILAELPADARGEIVQKLSNNASYFFEHPDLDPDGDLADLFLDDLAALHARTPPRVAQVEAILDDVAAYLRRPANKMQGLIEKHYALALAARLPANFSSRRVPAAVARASLDLIGDAAQRADFLYGPATLEWPDDDRSPVARLDSLWLLGIDQRLLLFAAGDEPRVIWNAAANNVHVEPCRQLLATGCRITGGKWELSQPHPLAIRLSAGFAGNYNSYFSPLLSMLSQQNRLAAT
jgi:DNA-binding transcriptional ArsR family regulator